MNIDLATLVDLSTRITGGLALVLFIYGILTGRIVTARELAKTERECDRYREERDEFIRMLLSTKETTGKAIDLAERVVRESK
jgi:hypothetical protein